MTPQKPIIASINTKLIGKSDAETLKKHSAHGWDNDTFSFEEFKSHLIAGYAYGYQWYGGSRATRNFLSTTVISADFDSGQVKLDDALSNPFIKNNAAFIYTTSNHSEAQNRFRVVFISPLKLTDSKEVNVINLGLHQKLIDELGDIDQSTSDAARFFFGCSNSIVFEQDKVLSYQVLDELRVLGGKTFLPEDQLIEKTPPKSNVIDKDQLVQLPHSHFRPLSSLRVGQSIHCPFHSPDHSPSAFVMRSNEGVLGVHCRSCSQSWFTGKTPPQKFNFFKIDELITANQAKANTNFEYSGLTKLFPELETSPAVSNFSVKTEKHLGSLPVHKGIHLIKSPKGTGKTVALGKVIENAKFHSEYFEHPKDVRIPVILIGHRQALLRESAEKLGLTCYLDSQDYDTKVSKGTVKGKPAFISQKPEHYAICLDSLASRMRLDIEKYPIVIIDESEQVFSHLSSTSMKKPESNFNILANLIASASHVYCLDADMGEITIEGVLCSIQKQFLSRNRKSTIGLDALHHTSNIYFHLNNYQRHAGELQLFQDKDHLRYDLAKALHDRKKCYVTANSKTDIDEIYEGLKDKLPDLNILKVTSDNSGDEDIRERVKNIKQTMREYDAILSSPSLGTGIDITYDGELQVVDCVYGFFSSQVNTHFDIDQQLARVRHPKSVKVWVDSRNQNHLTFLPVIRQNLLDELDISEPVQRIDKDGLDYQVTENPYLELIAKIRQIRNESQNNFKNNFIEYKQWQGWTVVDVLKSNDASKRGKDLYKIGRKLSKEDAINAIVNADLLPYEQYKALIKKRERNEPITSEENNQCKKYWMNKFYKTQVTKDLCIIDDKGKLQQAIPIYETMTQSEFERLKTRRDIYSYDFNLHSVSAHAVSKINDKANTLMKIFETVGVFKNNAFLPNAVWSLPTLTEFIALCKEPIFRADVDRLFGMDIHRDIENKATLQLNKFLKLVGLEHTQIGRKRDKNSISEYSLDPDRLELINSIVERRKARGE